MWFSAVIYAFLKGRENEFFSDCSQQSIDFQKEQGLLVSEIYSRI